MYVGHLGIGLGAKRLRPTAWAPALLVAAVACDAVQITLDIAGVHDRPQGYSHSVPAAFAIAGAMALVYFAVTRRGRDAGLVGVVVLSHLPADYIAGRKLLWPGGPEVGLLLYDHYPADFALETAIIVLGWAAYRRTLPARWRRSWLMWGALATLVLAQLALNYYDYRNDLVNQNARPWWGGTPAGVVRVARDGDAAHIAHARGQ